MCHFFQRKKKQQSFQRLQISHYQLELESYKLEFTKVSALVSRESSITYLKNKGQKVSGLKDVEHKSLEQEYPHNHSPPPPKAEIRTGMKGGENKYIQVSLESEACPLTDDKTDKARADGQVRWLPRQQLCTRPVPQEIPGSGGGGVRERPQQQRTPWAPLGGPPRSGPTGHSGGTCGPERRTHPSPWAPDPAPCPLRPRTAAQGRWSDPGHCSAPGPACQGRGDLGCGRRGSLCGFSLKDSTLPSQGTRLRSHSTLRVSAFPTDNVRRGQELTLAEHTPLDTRKGFTDSGHNPLIPRSPKNRTEKLVKKKDRKTKRALPADDVRTPPPFLA